MPSACQDSCNPIVALGQSCQSDPSGCLEQLCQADTRASYVSCVSCISDSGSLSDSQKQTLDPSGSGDETIAAELLAPFRRVA